MTSTKEIPKCSKCKCKFESQVYMLECMHNFCETCINTMRQDSTTTCCLCATNTNSENVKRNIFMERMILMEATILETASKIIFCEICDPEIETKEAVNYCTECEQYMCRGCSKAHTRIKISSNHKIVDKDDTGKATSEKDDIKCQKHNENLKIYCEDCDVFICTVCYIMEHEKHKKDDRIEPIIAKSKNKIMVELDKIDKLIASQFNFQERKRSNKTELFEKVDEIKAYINERVRQVKESIDIAHMQFFEKLETKKDVALKEINDKLDESDKYLTSLNNTKSYIQNIIDNGSKFDIHNLKNEINKLKLMEDEEPKILTTTKLSFSPSQKPILSDSDELFGQLSDSKLSDPPDETNVCDLECDIRRNIIDDRIIFMKSFETIKEKRRKIYIYVKGTDDFN